MVSPQVTHYPTWEKGQIIELENNSWRGLVIVVRMPNGDVFWECEDLFRKIA